MSGIVLQATATGIGYRGAYTRYFNKREHFVRRRMQQEIPACETVKFVCPAPKCGAKNEHSILSSKGNAGDELIFICRKCEREIQVSRPHDDRAIIVPGINKPEHVGLLDAHGRKLG